MTKNTLRAILADKSRFFSYQTSKRIFADRDRLKKAAEKFFSLFPDAENIHIFSSPGRTEIGGNHTDHNRGRVLAAAVDLDTIAIAAPHKGSAVRVFSKGHGFINASAGLCDPDNALFGSSKALVQGVISVLTSRGFQSGGFDAYVESRVLPGSGLSSSASFEILIAEIQNALYNSGSIDALTMAMAAQEAENRYFGKPCGLMDQTACAVGGFVGIDFENPDNPIVTPVSFSFENSGYTLILTDTHTSHAGLTRHYAAISEEMRSVAACFGKSALRGLTQDDILSSVPSLRSKVSDRAILRALHFISEDERACLQLKALKRGDIEKFLLLVRRSGASSLSLLQNITVPGSSEQGLALALAVSDTILGGRGATRVHGGGFAGTIQAFVPDSMEDMYCAKMDSIFGERSCVSLRIRSEGAAEIL